MYSWDGAKWKHEDHKTPPNVSGITSGPGVAYYLTPSVLSPLTPVSEKYLHIDVFVVGNDSTLWTRCWDGKNWQWKRVGIPEDSIPGAGYLSSDRLITPGVITYKDSVGTQRTIVFVPGGAYLYPCNWDGSNAQWWDINTKNNPHKVDGEKSLSSITYKEKGTQHFRTFIMQDELWEQDWIGIDTNGTWNDRGTPEGKPDNIDILGWGNSPVATSFGDFVVNQITNLPVPVQRVFVFSIKNKKNQHLYYWDSGNNSNILQQWIDPFPNGPKLTGVPSMIQYSPIKASQPSNQPSYPYIIVFGLGSDDLHLYMYTWNGVTWMHEDLRKPIP